MKNEHSDLWNLVSLLKKVILAYTVVIILIIAGFLLYLSLNQKENYQTISTNGVYNLVNSENGEIIATDLTSEQIEKIMELLDGKY